MSKRKVGVESSTSSTKKVKICGDTLTQNQDAIPPDLHRKLEGYLKPFHLSQRKLKEVSAQLRKDLIRGLGKRTHNKAPVKMLPTFVRAIPDGTEKGNFLALDIGGTNLRVYHVQVDEQQKELKTKSESKWRITKKVKEGTGENLFKCIAERIYGFLESKNLKRQTLPLGFTFSFPCEQKEIDKSDLVCWTKGFSCSGVVGRDVVQLLSEAIRDRMREDYDICVVAMVNDTVGTMMSCGYEDQSCEIGMIIGTGTNTCYMEEMKNVKYLEGDDGQMCINTEWGGFGDDGSLKDIQTEFDQEVDKRSENPGVHIFEKMTSGMYLGEIVRLLLVKMMEAKLLFNGQTSKVLKTRGGFKTEFISWMEMRDKCLKNAKRTLTKLGLDWDLVHVHDVHVVRWVCETISTRSAHLCAAALATIADHIRVNRGLDHLKTTVGVDGSVYKEHPKFKQKLKEKVDELAPTCSITFIKLEDSSGKGAAIAAAVVQRLRSKV